MLSRLQPNYRGPLKAVILDWAGTTVDYGSFAPTAVFLKLFAGYGVNIRVEQARRPMGLMKKDHLRAIANDPEVSQAWLAVHGHEITTEEIDKMFDRFVPMQKDCLEEYAQVIPGVLETIEVFRQKNLKIGSTTGYTREMMRILVPAARCYGYIPDAWVAADDVPAGRPYPWMAYENAIQLEVFPMTAFVKIGDTLPDIQEGLNAGMWTIGLSITGNLLGLTRAEAAALPEETLDEKRKEAAQKLYQAGAHFVVDGLSDCPPVLAEINDRLAHGERP